MKKAFLSPLCSAFVIPGLGQIINQQWKKGLVLLGAVFVLFIMAAIAIYALLKSGLSESSFAATKPEAIIERICAQDFSALWIVLGVSAVVWIYSVLDAFWTGRKIDHATGQSQQ